MAANFIANDGLGAMDGRTPGLVMESRHRASLPNAIAVLACPDTGPFPITSSLSPHLQGIAIIKWCLSKVRRKSVSQILRLAFTVETAAERAATVVLRG